MNSPTPSTIADVLEAAAKLMRRYAPEAQCAITMAATDRGQDDGPVDEELISVAIEEYLAVAPTAERWAPLPRPTMVAALLEAASAVRLRAEKCGADDVDR